ncbi:Ca2+-binding RTX toxin-like protein [Paenibacillus mucilaginosus]|uniref:calcium-binding protein n=1 Tax=Paenibacillus mucilaginosus TaxID=61624 RepID=UPI003D1E7815
MFQWNGGIHSGNRVSLGDGQDDFTAFYQEGLNAAGGEGGDRGHLYYSKETVWTGGSGADELELYLTEGGSYYGGADNDTFIDTANYGYSEGISQGNTLYGGTGADTFQLSGTGQTVLGGADEDHISGVVSESQVYGEGGNDLLNGGTMRGISTELLMDGGAGDDQLISGGAGNILLGGTGSDTLSVSGYFFGQSTDNVLSGGAGADVYDIGPDFRRSVIREEGLAGETDTVHLYDEYRASDATVSRSGSDLVLNLGEWNGSQQALTVERFFDSAAQRIERFEFGDGSVWTDTQDGAAGPGCGIGDSRREHRSGRGFGCRAPGAAAGGRSHRIAGRQGRSVSQNYGGRRAIQTRGQAGHA